MWEEAAALDPGDDPVLQSFHDEGARSLDTFGLIHRVMATATAPSDGADLGVLGGRPRQHGAGSGRPGGDCLAGKCLATAP
jgi:hypothetical protein